MATKQLKLDFQIRKNPSRLSTCASLENEKENEISCNSPSRRSQRINKAPVIRFSSNSEAEHDKILPVQSSPSKCSTPSKRKIQHFEEPSSPPKVVCQLGQSEVTPSTKLTSLSLNSPESKPATRISPSPHARKDLFAVKENSTNVDFCKARQAFHTSSTDSLPGREKELADLKEFFVNHIKNETSGSIYISGPPGTGKTASLTHLMNQKEIKGCFQTVYINCTSVKSPGALYSHIASQLNVKVRGRPSEKSCLAALEKYFSSKRKMLLFVLDEMDQLESRGQSVLYTVFEWPVIHPKGIVLVGIANALDLTDRTLPRLRAREDLAPKLLHFTPYSRQQIVNILKLRLEEAGVGDVFSAPALQMLASKVAAVSGDVRRALDIGRRVIEISGNPFRGNPQPVPAKTVLEQTENLTPRSPLKVPLAARSPNKCASPASLSPKKLSSPSKTSSPYKVGSPKKTWTSPRKLFSSPTKASQRATAPSPTKTSHRKLFQSPARTAVDVKSVLTVVNEVYSSSQSVGHGADELPLQQRLAICSLMLILKNSKSKDVTVAKLHDVYRRVCNKRKFEPLDQAAFLSMLSLVESRGILSLQGKGQPGRLSKVCLKWVEDEIVAALRDRDLLASILSDVACLS